MVLANPTYLIVLEAAQQRAKSINYGPNIAGSQFKAPQQQATSLVGYVHLKF
jgi:hypothetical protein